jgi:heterodisulfide reductase subunit B
MEVKKGGKRMDYALFLGCIIPNRYPGIELSIKKVAENMGFGLKDLPGASCCPAPGVFKSFDHATWLALAARNLVIAESLGADVVTMCNGCYSTLKETNKILKNDFGKRNEVNEVLKPFNKEFKGTINVKHLLEVLYNDIGLEKIKGMVKKPLNLKIAVHYGCHIVKPTKERENIKSAERPKFFDELVEVLGAKSISYKDKMMCCGAGGGVRAAYLDTALDMTREKLENAQEAGADCIVTPCAFCHLQLDRGQIEIRDRTGTSFNMPILHYVQLLGLALGLKPEELGLFNNAVPVDSVLKKIGT